MRHSLKDTMLAVLRTFFFSFVKNQKSIWSFLLLFVCIVGLCGQSYASGVWVQTYSDNGKVLYFRNGARQLEDWVRDLHGDGEGMSSTMQGGFTGTLASPAGELQGSVNCTLNWHSEDGDLPPRKVVVLMSTYSNIQIYKRNGDVINNPTIELEVGKNELEDEDEVIVGSRIEPLENGELFTQFKKTHDLLNIDNTQRRAQIPLPTRFLKARYLFNNFPILGEESESYVNMQVTCEVKNVEFSLLVRRKPKEPEPNSVFSSNAKIAGGGKEPEEHFAQVQISMSPAAEGIHIPWIPKILQGDGVSGVHASFIPSGVTKTNAQGKVVLGEVRSSSRLTSTSKPMILELPVGLPTPNPKASVNVVWDEHDEWTMEPYLLGNENNTFVRFKPKFDGVPITGHTLTMHVAKIKLTFWNSATNHKRTRIITTDPAEVDLEANPQVVLGDPTAYASFDGNATDEGEGVYKGKLELHPPETVTIEQLWFKARDEGVYQPKPENN